MKKTAMPTGLELRELFKLREDSMRVARGEKPIWGELEFPVRIKPDDNDPFADSQRDTKVPSER